MTRKRRIGIGVVGCGYWGPKLIRNLTEMADVDLIAVCDLSEERLAGLVERHPGLNTTTDYRDLLQDPRVDAIVVATPIRTHFRLALAALQEGKHVLVEKPLTAGVEESEQLIEASERAGRVLMVGHTFQYNPAVEKLREVVQSGELGQIYYVDCARLNLGLFQGDINVIWDLAPHDLSILLHILGERPESLSAYGAAHVLSGIDDTAHLTLRFAGGLDAHVRLSWLDPCKVRRVTVVGSKKMAIFDDTAADKLILVDRRVALSGTDVLNRPMFDYHDGEIEALSVSEAEPLRLQIEHFLSCIRSGATPVSDGRMGSDVVSILEASDRSRALNGEWVDLRRATVSLDDMPTPARAERVLVPSLAMRAV